MSERTRERISTALAVLIVLAVVAALAACGAGALVTYELLFTEGGFP